MARRGKRERGKEHFWRHVLRQWRRSGQGVRPYCAEHGLSEPSFYAWRRTIQQRDRQAEASSQRVRRQAGEPVANTSSRRRPGAGLPAFVPVTVVAPAPSLEVVLRDGRAVRVPAGFDAASLRQLLAVLAEAPPC
jgi:transposase-like protein